MARTSLPAVNISEDEPGTLKEDDIADEAGTLNEDDIADEAPPVTSELDDTELESIKVAAASAPCAACWGTEVSQVEAKEPYIHIPVGFSIHSFQKYTDKLPATNLQSATCFPSTYVLPPSPFVKNFNSIHAYYNSLATKRQETDDNLEEGESTVSKLTDIPSDTPVVKSAESSAAAAIDAVMDAAIDAAIDKTMASFIDSTERHGQAKGIRQDQEAPPGFGINVHFVQGTKGELDRNEIPPYLEYEDDALKQRIEYCKAKERKEARVIPALSRQITELKRQISLKGFECNSFKTMLTNPVAIDVGGSDDFSL